MWRLWISIILVGKTVIHLQLIRSINCGEENRTHGLAKACNLCEMCENLAAVQGQQHEPYTPDP